MGLNWQEGLERVSGNIDKFANYYAQRETRDWQERQEATNRAFQERLVGLQQNFQREESKTQRDFLSDQKAEDREFQLELFDKQSAIQQSQFAQQLNMDQQRLGVAYAQLEQNAANADRQMVMGAMTAFMNAEGAQYKGVIESMNKEIEALAKNPMLSMYPERMDAARSAIEQRYAPQITEASNRFNTALNSVMEEAGTDFRVGEKSDEFMGEEDGAQPAAMPSDQAPDPGGETPNMGVVYEIAGAIADANITDEAKIKEQLVWELKNAGFTGQTLKRMVEIGMTTVKARGQQQSSVMDMSPGADQGNLQPSSFQSPGY